MGELSTERPAASSWIAESKPQEKERETMGGLDASPHLRMGVIKTRRILLIRRVQLTRSTVWPDP